MSLGSLNMAGNSLGAALSLLFLASITQGHEDVPIFCHDTWEAVVGQNVALPCTMKNRTDFRIASIEWTKKTATRVGTKLAVYSTTHGLHQFTSNVTIKPHKDDANDAIGFPVYLSAVTKWDSGIYVCDVTSFPYGSLRCETQLKINDIDKIICDVNGTVEARSGENVTIHCAALLNVQYRWTKNQTLVSDTRSLELWQVTDAHSGIYSVSLNTGSKTLHEEFNIIVLTVTTSLTTGLVSETPPSIVTTQGPIDSTVNSLSTTFQSPPTTGLWTTAATVTWPGSVATDVTDAATNASHATNATEELFTNNTHISVTSSSTTHTDTFHLLNATTSSSSSAAVNQSRDTTSDGLRVEPATQPDNVSVITPDGSSILGNITEISENATTKYKTKHEVKGNERSHLLALIMVPSLVLIVVVGFLVRRHIIKQRMDLPPPFKPPPPPVKYAGAVYKHREISAKSYPIARCNSLAECI